MPTDHGPLDRSISDWKRETPLLGRMLSGEEVCWRNPGYRPAERAALGTSLSLAEIRDTEARLMRFAPLLARLFPETAPAGGVIESPLMAAASLQQRLSEAAGSDLPGRLLLKCDNLLPVSGSIKARGGIHEVLEHAEELALGTGRFSLDDDHACLDADEWRAFFARHAIAVGSTGNLGLSIGIMGARLGFHVFVHMSADARQWKKDLLREKGASMVEHTGDYSAAVAVGRQQAADDPAMYFVDDEASTRLFLGYAVAALRLQRQLADQGIVVDAGHPLCVYLPCGVGGGPGGITFGLKQIFGEAVHAFFVEPVAAPCMALGLMTGLHEQISVQDFGLDGVTVADGLAVGRPSGFVGRALQHMIAGVFTVDDRRLLEWLALMMAKSGLPLEPSAVAGVAGPLWLAACAAEDVDGMPHWSLHSAQATHVVWLTGGGMVPEEELLRDLGEVPQLRRYRPVEA